MIFKYDVVLNGVKLTQWMVPN